MAKTEKKNKSPLPIPRAALLHHEKTLAGPMKEWKEQKRIPPVLLLTGSSGVGKRTIAHYLAQWALCSEQGPCGKCPNCKRAEHGTWVDFTEILSDDPEDPTAPLKIDRFRKLRESMGFGAHDGAYRITLISNAERMTPQAANSVLKLLEEPPPGWIILLTASDPSLLLPTIVSRCQVLRLKPFSTEALEALLAESGIEPSRRKQSARLAQGSWGKAIQISTDEFWKHRETLFQFLENPETHINSLVDWASQDDAHLILLVDLLEQLTAEKILEQGNDIHKAREFWIARGERLAAARHQISLPLNRKLLIQDLLLPWVSQ